MNRKTVSIAAAVVCFLLLSASSCATHQIFINSGAPKIQFNGDSITFQATDDINAHFGGAYDVGIDATAGYDTYQSEGMIATAAAQAPAVEIINLGTNDASRIATGATSLGEPVVTLDDALAHLDTFATEFPASTCVIFVNVDTHNPSWGPTQAQAINNHMSANPSLFPRVVDWNGTLTASDFDVADSPHPNEAGRQALLTLEDAAIATCS